MFDITPGGWYADLGAWAAAITASGVIFQKGARPVFRAIWIAVLAAPRIAEGAENLIEMLEGDVLKRLDEGSKKFAATETRLDQHDAILVEVGERLIAVEKNAHSHSNRRGTRIEVSAGGS